jgi:LacI family transcriptional regulator
MSRIATKITSANKLVPILSDVARRARVSKTTASRVLNPTSQHPVKQLTRQRVLRVAASMGYRPNPMARALRTRQQPTIAVLVHDVTDLYFAEIVRGATIAASRSGFLTVVCSSSRDPATELKYLEMLSLSRVAGVIFAGGGLEDVSYKRAIRIHAANIRSYGGVLVALAPRADRWPAELPDNEGGAHLATEHLLALGHRDIAMISGPINLRTSREREHGYQQALTAQGLAARLAVGDFTRQGGARAMAELLAGPHLSAVFVSNDAMAVGALAELRRRGVAVPGDMSLVGFDDVPGLDYLHPALTTVRVPMADLGAAGANRVLKLLSGADRGPRVRTHPVELVLRESTAAPSQVLRRVAIGAS